MQQGCTRGVGKPHVELTIFYSGSVAAAHLLYLLGSSTEVCKGLTKLLNN